MNLFPYTLMRIGGISFEKLEMLCINSSLFEEIIQSIETLQNSSELENQFSQELIYIRENIKTLSKECALRNGLVLSAPSVLDRIASYQEKEITRFRKKEKQTERTIVQYLTRIATKTSPFSTFNQIGLAEIKEQSDLIENAEFASNQSFVRINNYILKSFKDSIVQDRTLVQGLRIIVNSTLIQLENGYEFLVNDDNIEAFQTMGDDPVVQLIFDKMELGKTVFSELIDELGEEVEAEKEDLENFVLELHKIGLLEFDIKVSSLDGDWELKCLELLEYLPNCELSENWKKLLSELAETKDKYTRVNFKERRILLKNSFRTFNYFFKEINKNIEKLDETVFKKQFDNQLMFNETNLLYEDYAVQSSLSISKKEIEILLNTLNAFIKVLQPFQKNEEMEELTHFYKEHYNNVSVDLLEFYKVFSKKKLSKNIENDAKSTSNKEIQEWKLALKKILVIENHIVNIEIEKLKRISSDCKDTMEYQSNSAFVQLYQNGNDIQCFLNSFTSGDGKYFSRFLHLFPEKITKQLQERNNSEERIFAEINDNSFFNANIHPPLMPFEIKLSDGNAQLPEQRQILLKDIEVIFKNDRLKLIHQLTAKEIIPFDLGFQALAGRSELFKLLNIFSNIEYSSVHQVINIVNDLIENQQEIQVFPRIMIENQITIQRKTWIIAKNSIPKQQQKHETEWILYKRILNWVKENNLPQEGFYTINANELAKDEFQIRNTDAYKPQYINFKNPVLVQLFIRSCKKIEASLKLEEMLPNSNDLIIWNKKKYVSEFLLQWRNSRN